MMRVRSLFLVAAGALATGLIVGAAPGHTTLNGLSFNGMSFNGMSVNGVSMNGVSVNGVALNGTRFNGVRPDAAEGALNAPLADLATRPLLR